ncbi:MAG: PEP-CTERM sorting domain-containing protein [Burkholderiales bacterium]|nr:PEP-CTERM sorting domain-containing protein [Burkholderiales bacterium]
MKRSLNSFLASALVATCTFVGSQAFASGTVHTTDATNAAVVSAASGMIYNAQHASAGSTQYSFNLYTNGSNQDYLVATMGSVTPVQEPETYAMLLAGLGLIGFTASRRRVSK